MKMNLVGRRLTTYMQIEDGIIYKLPGLCKSATITHGFDVIDISEYGGIQTQIQGKSYAELSLDIVGSELLITDLFDFEKAVQKMKMGREWSCDYCGSVNDLYDNFGNTVKNV